jgi:DNA modification methylase
MPKKRRAAQQWPSFKRYTTVARDAARASAEQNQSLTNSIWCGDCRDVLRDKFPDDYFDLIVTSPPYAEARKSTYGGIHADRYAAWMLERTSEFLRVLKPTGSFILNIKEKVIDGERHTYVIDLIKGMRSQGWLWTEEFIWHKKNCYPGKWPNRFRDSWERLLQFNKSRDFKMRQESVMVPMGNWKDARLRNLSETDRRRDESRVRSGFGKNVSKWVGREMAYPTNVLHRATECANRNHSAVFPYWLPEWFMHLFTDKGDKVLDPFLGSGTTAVAARDLGRWFVGIDINEQYCAAARTVLTQASRKGTHGKAGPRRGSRLRESEHWQLSFQEAEEPSGAEARQGSEAEEPVSIQG